MSKSSDRPNLRQGEGGGAKTKRSGSKFVQGEGGAAKRGSSGSKFAQGEGGAKPRGPSGSHLEQQPSMARGKRSSERGGHSRTGYDHGPSPTAGKAKSGSKFTQHPSNRK